MAHHHESSTGTLADPRYLIQTACLLADSLGFLEVRLQDLTSAVVLPERLRTRPELAPGRLHDQVRRRMATFGM